MLVSRLFKVLIFIAATSLVAGCKLAVMVTSGGDVISASGTRNCAAGSVCEFDVAANFNETFTAVPRPGYEFVQWRGNKKSTLLCADQTSPTCTYSLLGNPNAATIAASTEFGYLKPEFRDVGIDTDRDGLRNEVDGDDDNDGIPDGDDACPLDPTPNCNLDTDGDGTPNAVDTDDDGDGVADAADECPLDPSPACRDTDGDGVPDNFDTNDDGDGKLDVNDPCPLDRNLLCGTGTTITAANTVTVNGRVWAQPDKFIDLTWDQINAVCPTAVCITEYVLKGYDMTGWKWASFSEVWDMFTVFGAAPYSSATDIQNQVNSAWGPAYYAAGFRVTKPASLPSSKETFAWTSNRTPDSQPYGSAHIMMRLIERVSTTANDTIWGREFTPTTKFAGWFYKDDTDGDGITNDVDTDDDGDGTDDIDDECPLNADLACKDTDHDGMPDEVDGDDDNDGLGDAADECPLNSDLACKDTDRDGIPNSVDEDDDGDGAFDNVDECPLDARPECVDTDNDGIPDDLDPDMDGDGVMNGSDNCPLLGPDQDGFGCPVDPDADDDGVNDTSDQCPGTPIGAAVNAVGCATTQIDTDGDGVFDANDQCPNTPPGDMVDAQGCTVVLDGDTDGVPDVTDSCPLVGPNLNGWGCPWPLSVLNDTGITFGGNYPSGNNVGCTGVTVAQQDCSNGRDATHNDNADGYAGFSYTKLASDGTLLPASAVSWACVRDNVTGLVWENKTNDGGIHDRDNTYRWGGKTAQGTGYGTYYPDWDVLVDGSNNEALCGFTDWRVPTRLELHGLGKRNGNVPAIDTVYFPIAVNTEGWSAEPSARNSSYAWTVFFNSGESFDGHRSTGRGVRLVRTGQ